MIDRSALLSWYRPRRRLYPWRRRRDPYLALVSEVMLQQTQAARVAPAFEAFIDRFPTVRALAAAPKSDVLRAWANLGYNRRAVALSDAARMIVDRYGGNVPSDLEELKALPGVGPYTAAAVASLGHGMPVAAVDTNVARVVSRVRFGVEPAAIARVKIQQAAAGWLDRSDAASWNQALMDLGREVCRVRPRCEACPLARRCRFRASDHRPARRRAKQSRFEGSFRQLRGAVVAALRESDGSMSVGALARTLQMPLDRVAGAVAALAADGVVDAGRAALAGHRAGRVRFPS